VPGEATQFYVFFVLTLVVAAIHLIRNTGPRTIGRVAEVLLLWFLVIFVWGLAECSASSGTPSRNRSVTPGSCRTSNHRRSTAPARLLAPHRVIGTPDDAITQIERLHTQSGGFGTYLLMHDEWARPDATARSYELFARHVMPRFQAAADRLRAAAEHARSRRLELDRRHAAAILAATERHAPGQS
jgi:hypothetical protein